MVNRLRPQQIGMMIAAATTVLLWLIPGAHLILLPLQYLDTHLHEMSHALATVFTGGSVETIQVYGNGSGVTQSLGVHHWVIVASAGYVGASLIGAALIFFSRDELSARRSLIALACLLFVEDLLWLHGDSIGKVSGFFYLVAFIILGLTLRGWAAILVAQFVGLQQCLAALGAVVYLVNPRVLAFSDNDASILQNQTGVPAILWSFGWAALSVVLMVLTFASAWRAPKRSFRSRTAAG